MRAELFRWLTKTTSQHLTKSAHLWGGRHIVQIYNQKRLSGMKNTESLSWGENYLLQIRLWQKTSKRAFTVLENSMNRWKQDELVQEWYRIPHYLQTWSGCYGMCIYLCTFAAIIASALLGRLSTGLVVFMGNFDHFSRSTSMRSASQSLL